MKLLLLRSFNYHNFLLKQKALTILIAACCLSFCSQNLFAQGTWTAVTSVAPHTSGGGTLLLSDGTILCKSTSGGLDSYGSIYDRLIPDNQGNYANGTWSSIAPMHSTRLYYSTQLLKDGRVYVAGGEYGTGGSSGETYNPLTNVWTSNGPVGSFVSDANSEILDNGTVIQALVSSNLKPTKIYDPTTNLYTTGPSCVGIHNESVWVKLKDNSILFVDRNTRNSERFIPSLNQWIADATLPTDVYDPYGLESGAAVLLPDGRVIFFGSTGHNAIYTPSGSTANGSWVAAADFPNGQGTPDAPAAMMANGKVLCAVSPKATSSNHFPTPTSYYEYDYTTNAFTRVNAPGGGLTTNISVYQSNMVDLPNGQVLFSVQGSNQYYVYTPDGTQLASGKPTITKIQKAGPGVFKFTGHLFNGISEGASYGDDWQMSSNYPIVRITVNAQVFYARTFNWNSTGVMRGNLNDTCYITLPAGLPRGKYSIAVLANGISSNPYNVGSASLMDDNSSAISTAITINQNKVSVYPNPATTQTSVQYSIAKSGYVSLKIVDVNGRSLTELVNGNMQQGEHNLQLNTSRFAKGVYYLNMITDNGIQSAKLVVQ
ncbi:MAG: T9SS type A sorting domain-containing protein [Parafilimonas sp.]